MCPMRSSLKWARVSFLCAIVAHCFHHNCYSRLLQPQGEMIISIFVDGIHHVVFFNRSVSACCRTQYVCSSFIRSFVCNLNCTPTVWWKVVSQHYVIYTCVCAGASWQSYHNHTNDTIHASCTSKLKCAHFISLWLRWHIKCSREYNTPRQSALHKIIIIYEVFVVNLGTAVVGRPPTPPGRALHRFKYLEYFIYLAFQWMGIQNHNFLRLNSSNVKPYAFRSISPSQNGMACSFWFNYLFYAYQTQLHFT